ncbi:MAG: FKBP-type peptidyl-prolyl cis-trans isomerase [Dysgonamonadaceae bacterium]|nr:FKBP-type peptidyl-prolyl cis-trans isomerase [Dysgonamonadaceae bacterium]
MKKLVCISTMCLAFFAMVTMVSCTPKAPKANLKTEIDSLAYATGVNMTQGLSQYLEQLGIEDAQKADFLAGFLEGAKVNKDDKKTIARLTGLQIGQQVLNQMLPNTERQIFGSDSTRTLDKANFLAGFLTAVKNDSLLLIKKEEAQMYASTVGQRIHMEQFEKENAEAKASNAKFLEENKSKEGVVTLPSGLQYKVISEGKGPKPAATDFVKVDYTGTLIDGTEFDSSAKNGGPLELALNRVIAGWTEGIQLMPVGSKYIFYIPYNLAYGEQGRPGNIPPYATLIFDVTLHEIVKK